MSHHGLVPIEKSTLGTLDTVPGLLSTSLLQRGDAQDEVYRKSCHMGLQVFVSAYLGTVISNAGSPVDPCPSLASVVVIKHHDQRQL